MIGPNGNGGGGIALKIIRAASALTLPATAAANTIAVITETEITGWVFSVSEPETPAEGTVWFATGTRSPVAVNILKKNGIWIYPASCQQYISGSWVSKTAKTYKGGAWVDWICWLYKDGAKQVEFSEFTPVMYNTKATVTWGASSLTLAVNGANTTIATFGCAAVASPMMDVAGYKTLNARYESLTGTPKFQISVSTNSTPSVGGDNNYLFGGADHIAVATISEVKNSAGVLSLDISALSETEVRCCCGLASNDGGINKKPTAVVTQFWLE